MSKLSEAICRIRKSLGTQTDAARTFGIKQNTLSQYEAGLVDPSFGVLMRIYNLAPLGPDRQFILEHLTSQMKTDRPELVEDIAAGYNFLHQTPPAETPHQIHDLEEFAGVVEMIRNRGPKLQKSVNDILRLWILYGNNPTARQGFRDAAKYLQMYLDVNVDGRSPDVARRKKRPRKD
jgi:transcriptional regulator with XRE-family HTH domain